MIPIEKIKLIVEKYNTLEKQLASSDIDKKDFVQKSKEYSNIGEIINEAKGYLNLEKEKEDLDKILNEKDGDAEMIKYHRLFSKILSRTLPEIELDNLKKERAKSKVEK